VILGGTVPITGRNPVRDDLLIKAIQARSEQDLSEIILGLSATAEGEETRDHVLNVISPLLSDSITLSTLGRGLATGTQLEYSDDETLRNALSNRK